MGNLDNKIQELYYIIRFLVATGLLLNLSLRKINLPDTTLLSSVFKIKRTYSIEYENNLFYTISNKNRILSSLLK